MFRRVAVLAALTLTATAGCAEKTEPAASPSPAPSASASASPVAGGAPWYDEVAPAAAGTTVGPEGSACPLPMTFSVPPKWKVEAVKVADAKIGPALMLCEIDAKPAGHIGFLRVWRIEGAKPLDPQVTVDKYIAGYGKEAKEKQYRRTKAGSLDAYEATWIEEDGSRERALVVSTLYGRVMLSLESAGDDEFAAMLPAYLSAKSTAALPK
ncbi:lipoprotein [Micromonospora okii]|uniref:lipoprotein n=1 Tax=Micromonospora okii TaxID=1182970 RepID=UPI001E60E601|nr:lipoprotein [Micromonospora okii]